MRKRPIDDSGNVKAFAGVAGKGAFLCGFAALAAAVFLAALFCGGNGGRDAWAAVTLPQNVIPTTKRGLPPEDNWKLTARKANVLFVLDVGSPMTFTATGTMPEWGVNVTTQAQAGQMLKQATYGHGGLDVEGTTSNSFPRTRYGREGLELVDEANNMTPGNTALSNHLNNYYSPDSENPYKLVFKNTKSGWWKNGPGNEQFTKADLVPNDSRMYKMKLVMWRVLSDVVLLENLRVGMATTFQELNGPSTGYGADFYKADPYGVWSSIPNFPYGTGPSWATNLADAFGNGQGYKDSASAYWGLDREYYDRSHSDRLWKLLNRAYLRLPIDDYSQGHIDKFRLWLDGQENITVTVNDSSKPYYFTNPELYGDGKTYLSTAIYPGHPHLSRATLISTTDTASPTGAQGVVFSHRSAATIASIYSGSSYGKALANFNAGAALGNYFKAGSGEALGTLLDFFSPPVSGIGDVTQDAQNVRMAPASSFPIRDQCEKNWVVIFTAGDDSGDDSAGYTSAEAVKKLYEFTRDNDVTKLSVAGTDSTNNTFEGVRLDDGVRTLVVGFVDPESTAANVVALRDKLNAMAVAGDPGNEKAKAYFANDTEGLINALRAVLARINSDIQPAPGPMTESPAMGDEEGGDEDENYNLFDASYRVVLYDQWMGSFARNEVKKIGDQLETEEVWELDTDLMSSNARDSRKIYYWRVGVFERLKYTTPGSSGANDKYEFFADMTGITNTVDIGMDISNLQGRTFDKLHPSRNLINWLHGYDYSYIGGNEVKRKSMLADFGQSTSALAGPPSSADNPIAGYKDWALTQQGIATRLYAQTNDGILHVINPARGIAAADREQMAILPPPSLLPLRLARLKMTPANNGMLRWIDARDFSTFQYDDIPISSIPSYVLDGPVQMSRFDIDNNKKWKSILIAMLGRAGNGLYTMDVSAPDAPEFYWYYETLENSDGSLTLVRMNNSDAEPVPLTVTPDWGKIHESPNSYPLYQLGFNSPKPKAGIAKLAGLNGGYRNMIVVPGGVQRSLDLGNNGRIGAALYILNPDVSKHTGYSGNPDAPGGPWATDPDSGWAAVFNGGSLKEERWRVGSAASGPDPYMGMMVSVPTLAASQSNRYVTSQIYASDNRGSVFMLPLEDSEGNVVSFGSAKLRTVATLRADGDLPTDSYASPHGLAIGRIDDDIWLAGGTANVPSGPGNGADVAYNQINADAALENKIKNKFQMIYAFKLPDLVSGDTSRRGSWHEINSADLTDKAPADSPGWYRKLDPVSTNYGEEYVTVQPEIFDGHIFYATYLKKPTNPENSGFCDDSDLGGKSRIYALDMSTGGGGFWKDGSYIEIEGGIVTGMNNGEDTLDVSVGVTDIKTFDSSKVYETSGGGRASYEGKFNRRKFFRIRRRGGGKGGNFPAATTFINYWMIK